MVSSFVVYVRSKLTDSGCSLGPVCFVILCEVSATRVRSKTIGIATAAQALLGIVMTVAIPYLINA